LRAEWRELVGDTEVKLDADACPACGCAQPLVAGACADCGLQLE
jgi:hypothetical protein